MCSDSSPPAPLAAGPRRLVVLVPVTLGLVGFMFFSAYGRAGCYAAPILLNGVVPVS